MIRYDYVKYWSQSQWRRTSCRRSKAWLSLFRPWNRLFLSECIWCILVLTLPLAWLSQQSGELHGKHRVMRPCIVIVWQPPVSNCELVCSAEICFQLAAQIRSTISTHASAPRIIPSLLLESKNVSQGRNQNNATRIDISYTCAALPLLMPIAGIARNQDFSGLHNSPFIVRRCLQEFLDSEKLQWLSAMNAWLFQCNYFPSE